MTPGFLTLIPFAGLGALGGKQGSEGRGVLVRVWFGDMLSLRC